MLLLIVFSYFLAVSKCAIVIDRVLATCDPFSEKKTFILRQDWRASRNDVEVHFNVCGNLSEPTYGKHVAYVKNKTDNSITFVGDKFVPEGHELVLRGINRNNISCKLSVKLDCDTQETELRQLGDCDYEVLLFNPSSDCRRPCTMMLDNQLLNFTKLSKKYIVHSEQKNFSIFLCGPNPDCGREDVTSCDITAKHNISLSALKDEFVIYNERTNGIELHGKFKGPNDKKARTFEVLVKCNWFKTESLSSDLKYKKLLIPGRNYKFEMESSFGCVKLPPKCEFTDKFYKYNISKLYKPEGWKVMKVPGSKKMYLNMCGPLPEENNSCSETHSQICEVNNTEYISRGRIYLQPEISTDFISMKLISGDVCRSDTNKTYTTTIYLRCSGTEEHPVFVKDEDCDLHISWNTPKACPEINVQSCVHNVVHKVDPEIYKCTYDDVFPYYINSYDLEGLHSKSGYSFNDSTNTIQYLLNVCGPVADTKATCKNNAMVATKSFKEYDVRKKVTSYGEGNKIYVKNGTLIMETSGGDLCEHTNTDYKSTIFFECSDKSEISLKTATNCTLEFLWKTNYACPKEVSTAAKPCIFSDPLSDNYLLDFTTMKQTSLTVNVAEKRYLFDLCGNNKLKCNPSSCTYVPVNKSLVTYDNKTHLEFSMNMDCKKNQFNRTILELACDKIINNDHYKIKKIMDCTLILELKTSRACFEEEMVIPLIEESKVKNVPYKIDNSQHHSAPPIPAIEKKTDCMIKNPFTSYEFKLSRLMLNVSSSTCPEKSFNMESQVVILTYDIPKSCRNLDGELTEFDLKVIAELKCSKIQNNVTERATCFEKFTFNLPEACKLLESVDSSPLGQLDETGRVNGAVVAGGIVLAIFVAVIGLGSLYWGIRRYKKRSFYGSLAMSYEKDADD